MATDWLLCVWQPQVMTGCTLAIYIVLIICMRIDFCIVPGYKLV